MWWKVIIVSALSLSLRDKERLREREIDRERKRDRESLTTALTFTIVGNIDCNIYIIN